MTPPSAMDNAETPSRAEMQPHNPRRPKQAEASLIGDLRTIETLSCFHADPETEPGEICRLLFANMSDVLGLTALGLLLKTNEASRFGLCAAIPEGTRDALTEEFATQVKTQHLEDALEAGRLISLPPLAASATTPAKSVILLPLVTPRRAWGIGLALSMRSQDAIDEAATLLPNIILAEVAHIMETVWLTRRVAELEEDVDKLVESRHKSLIAQHREDLATIASLERESAGRSELLFLLGHELRTPLTSVISLAEFLLEERSENQQTNEFTAAIHEEAERMHRLLTDVMDLSKMETGKLRYSFMENDLNDLVDLCIASLNANARKRNITIRFERDESLPLLRFAPDRLQQAIVNMLSNAIKFSHDNSEIILTTRDEGDHVFFSVQDFGIGIAARDIPKVFNEFEQIERNGPEQRGYGFGMPLAKSIIDNGHGGKMWLKSKGRGHGTTFYFTLPKGTRPPAPAGPRASG